MKTFLRTSAFPALLIVALVVINGFTYYNNVCSTEELTTRNVYGIQYSATVAVELKHQKLLSNLTGDYDTDMATLEARNSLLNDYYYGAQYMTEEHPTYALHHWNLLPEEDRAEAAEAAYTACTAEFGTETEALFRALATEQEAIGRTLDYMQYLNDYHDYIRSITERTDSLADMSIFSENSDTVGNLVKTQKDFYGLENVTLTPVPETGFVAFLNFHLTDYFAVVIALVSLIAFRSHGDTYHRRKMIAPILLTVLGVLALYVCNLVLTEQHLGLPVGNALVQSMEAFQRCPYVISVSMLTVITVLLKLSGCLVVLFAAITILTARGKKRILPTVILGGLAIAEIVCATLSDAPAILREINVLSLFSFERFYIRYLNLSIFGGIVSRLPLFLEFAAVVFLATAFTARRGVSRYTAELIRENELLYYDEINHLYVESRKIRHDINNHLLALRALIEEGELEEAKRYIRDVSEQTELAAMPVNTGSNVLNALLFKKTEQAKEKGVSLSFEVHCPVSDSGISDYDLCTIFGNIIDNALEAVTAGQSIALTIDKQMDMLYISCENPYTGELRKLGDKLLTTKKDVTAHGYGISRVREVAGRYEGEVNITTEEGIFLIEILLNTEKRPLLR